MPNFPGEHVSYRWAPHASSPRRAVIEGVVLLLAVAICVIIALS